MTVGINGVEQTRPELAIAAADVVNVDGSSIPAMVGTNSAALASVLGALDSAATTGAVSSSDLVMAYVKQLVTEGIARDTAIGNIPTTMVGTDSAFLANVGGALDSSAATGAVSSGKLAMAYLKQLVTQGVTMMSWASVADDIIVIPGSGADLTFPNVVVAGIPTGATLIRAEVILNIGAILDTSSAENQIKTGTTDSLWIKVSGGSWGSDDIECLVFTALGLQVDADAYRGGATMFGAIDVKSEVTGNGTYNIASRETDRAKGVEATGATLELLDVTTMIRIWFY